MNDWEPLERALGQNLCHNFMYMGWIDVKGTFVYLYKHRDTRRYINLSDDGRAWRYHAEASPPYVEVPLETAKSHVLDQS